MILHVGSDTTMSADGRDETPLALRRPRRDLTPAPASMHRLYTPVKKDWGRAEWVSYTEGDRQHYITGYRKWTEQQKDEYFAQRCAAEIWAAPTSISLRVITPDHNAVIFEVAKLQRESLTLHHIIEEVCAAQGLDRLAYFWNLRGLCANGVKLQPLLALRALIG